MTETIEPTAIGVNTNMFTAMLGVDAKGAPRLTGDTCGMIDRGRTSTADVDMPGLYSTGATIDDTFPPGAIGWGILQSLSIHGDKLKTGAQIYYDRRNYLWIRAYAHEDKSCKDGWYLIPMTLVGFRTAAADAQTVNGGGVNYLFIKYLPQRAEKGVPHDADAGNKRTRIRPSDLCDGSRLLGAAGNDKQILRSSRPPLGVTREHRESRNVCGDVERRTAAGREVVWNVDCVRPRLIRLMDAHLLRPDRAHRLHACFHRVDNDRDMVHDHHDGVSDHVSNGKEVVAA